MRKYIAVIGLGSIGKRYVKKLNFLNYKVLGLDKKKFENEKNNFYFNNVFIVGNINDNWYFINNRL